MARTSTCSPSTTEYGRSSCRKNCLKTVTLRGSATHIPERADTPTACTSQVVIESGNVTGTEPRPLALKHVASNQCHHHRSHKWTSVFCNTKRLLTSICIDVLLSMWCHSCHITKSLNLLKLEDSFTSQCLLGFFLHKCVRVYSLFIFSQYFSKMVHIMITL